MRKRLIIGKRNLDIDFIQIFDNITYGKFFKRVYHIWFGQKGQLLPRLTPQLFSKVFPQRIKKNIFNGTVGKMRVSPLGGTSSLSHAGPIARFIAGSFEEIALNKGLDHVDWMGVFIYPVLLNPAHNATKDMAAKVRDSHVGQNKKSCIIGNEIDVYFPCFLVPADKGVSRICFPGSRAKE